MAINTNDVFLVAGQMLVSLSGEARTLSPVIEHRVLVAQNERRAFLWLNSMEPAFRPVGSATLSQCEKSITAIRGALSGADNELRVIGGRPSDASGKDVFLLSGQDDQQFVVVAEDESSALTKIGQVSGFKQANCTSLQTFESTASKLRESMKGSNSGWKLLVAPGMAC